MTTFEHMDSDTAGEEIPAGAVQGGVGCHGFARANVTHKKRGSARRTDEGILEQMYNTQEIRKSSQVLQFVETQEKN